MQRNLSLMESRGGLGPWDPPAPAPPTCVPVSLAGGHGDQSGLV